MPVLKTIMAHDHAAGVDHEHLLVFLSNGNIQTSRLLKNAAG